mgnify:CR=1 FL=1
MDLAGGSFSTYQYAYSNPLSYTDPMGLFTVNLNAYAGTGGGISVSYANGTLEVVVRLGVGYGGGISYEPRGTPSPHAKACGSGYIARTTGTTAAEIGVGPFSMMGRSFTGASGNAITTRVGGGYTQISGNTVSGEKGNGVGGRLEASVGVEIGSCSNWGSGNSCQCQ